MTERIIPIAIEKDEDTTEEAITSNNGSNNDDGKENSPVDESSPVQEKKPVQIQVKPFTESKDFEEYLKKYDVFEERSKFSMVKINVPEKIILVVDRAQDENCTNFMAGKSKFTPMTMLRKCLHLFVKLKHAINKNHEFAIMVLNENSTTWIMNFTSDMRKVNNTIEKITQCEVEDTFDMSLVFEEILPNIKIPQDNIAPPYIIRTIIFYGRSYTIPKIEFNTEIINALEHPFFICDVLMTHEPVDKGNHCNKIFECLQNIDKKGISYFFPVGRSSLRLHNSMAKLLGHGLQRPLQKWQKD